MTSSLRWSDVALLVLINTIWGASSVVSKVALGATPPYTLALLRFAVAFVILTPFALSAARRERWTPADYRALFVLGLTGFALSYALFYQGTVFAPASDVALIVVAEPLFIIGIARFMSSRPAPRAVVPAALVAFAGVALIAWHPEPTRIAPLTHILGDVLVVIGTAVQAWYGVFGERIAARMKPLPLTWASIGFGTLALAPLSAIEVSSGHYVALTSAATWFAVAYLAGGCTVFGYLLWFVILQRADVRTLGMSLYIQPVVGVVAAALFLHEPIGWQTLVGGLLVAGAVATVSREPGSIEADSAL